MAEPVLDSVELARFREMWRIEVQQRTHPHPSGSRAIPSHSTASIHSISDPPRQVVLSADELVPVARPSKPADAGPSTGQAHVHQPSEGPSKRLQSALAIYTQATLYEQQGQLEDALRLYQQAFRIDSNVDKAYHEKERRSATLVRPPPIERPRNNHQPTASVHASVIELAAVKANTETVSKPFGTLQELITTFPHDLAFDPEDEREAVLLNMLPDELLVLILMKMDVSSVERFATVNRKARLVTLDSSIWRNFVKKTYVPPQVEDGIVDNIVRTYNLDYRRIYIEQPRLRLDGVYIAVCHYVRQGLSRNAWVNVTHLITYHRYLRFLPDGRALSLLANEEVEPKTVVHQLKPTLSMKGFLIGRWTLRGTTVYITNLIDPTCHTNRYVFQMELTLRSRPLGRWNRLDFETYDSVHRESGEAMPLALKHERPFWFSKVRSY